MMNPPPDTYTINGRGVGLSGWRMSIARLNICTPSSLPALKGIFSHIVIAFFSSSTLRILLSNFLAASSANANDAITAITRRANKTLRIEILPPLVRMYHEHDRTAFTSESISACSAITTSINPCLTASSAV